MGGAPPQHRKSLPRCGCLANWQPTPFEAGAPIRRLQPASPVVAALSAEGTLLRMLAKLCACLGAGHGLLFSYYEALLNAIEQGDDAKLERLYEAGLTATIRLRLATSCAQLLADAHQWSESVRVSFCSASCDLLATVRMIGAIPNLMSRATSVEKFSQGCVHLRPKHLVSSRCFPKMSTQA